MTRRYFTSDEVFCWENTGVRARGLLFRPGPNRTFVIRPICQSVFRHTQFRIPPETLTNYFDGECVDLSAGTALSGPNRIRIPNLHKISEIGMMYSA